MSVRVSGVEKGSAAERKGFQAGDLLESINGHGIEDVLDYRFYIVEESLLMTGKTARGEAFSRTVRKAPEADPGLVFDAYLMDRQRSCRNKCLFCFIDQLPSGMRESLYFKDDDSRMGFLFGNYITLTNLEERDIQRILDMHISPVNVSVHAMNPKLREKMMGNARAGEALQYIPRLVGGGIRVNAQIVLCPGINDGPELARSLRELCALAPGVASVAVAPVGLTRYREGLAPLSLCSSAQARNVIETVDRFGDEMIAQHGQRICYAADEFYLMAGIDVPPAAWYGAFDQLENGVGMLALMQDEFQGALREEPGRKTRRRVTVATGAAPAPFLAGMAAAAEKKFPGLAVSVIPIVNTFFGHNITVAGLVTGIDLREQLTGCDFGDALLLPRSMLRHEGDLFLDGVSLHSLGGRLKTSIRTVPNDGYELLAAFLGEYL